MTADDDNNSFYPVRIHVLSWPLRNWLEWCCPSPQIACTDVLARCRVVKTHHASRCTHFPTAVGMNKPDAIFFDLFREVFPKRKCLYLEKFCETKVKLFYFLKRFFCLFFSKKCQKEKVFRVAGMDHHATIVLSTSFKNVRAEETWKMAVAYTNLNTSLNCLERHLFMIYRAMSLM